MPADSDVAEFPYLASLNAAQLKAVTAPPEVPLQILAGPGSGKTRVLTSRVAHLVRRHKLKPWQITAVTFTNKAAAEMRKRLRELLGDEDAGKLVLGTFHATCARFLRRYGKEIELDNNFGIADADDCKKIIARLLKEKSDELKALSLQIKEGAVLSDISKAKAKGESPQSMMARAIRDEKSTSWLSVVAEIYKEYEFALREAGALDFDDLLLYGLKLFRQHPEVLEFCQHILVDEFQDTNSTQYELMLCFGKAHGGVSIVGDPDQSIYGWRAAEVENLEKMTKDFQNVEAIYLEENYRSTGAILAASHSIVAQDKTRIEKDLFTSHPHSTPVTLKYFAEPNIEASFLATEIKRMVAYSGNTFNYDDFAVLLRYNALSRGIEAALQREGIPCRIIGGHKFFERMEIKDLLAYLQLADNPNFTPAFARVVNVPKRSIGEKTLGELAAAAKRAKFTPMALAERIVDGDQLPAGIKPNVRKNIASFVSVVRKVRKAALEGTSVGGLIRLILEKTAYENYLRNGYEDSDQRWENVQELINYSVIVEEEREEEQQTGVATGFIPAGQVSPTEISGASTSEVPLHGMFRTYSGRRSGSADVQPKTRVKTANNVIEILDSDDEDVLQEESLPQEDNKSQVETNTVDSSEPLTPLRYFLQKSMLSTDTESDKSDEKIPMVTISTIHAAKGLEWPVVFLPAVEQGTIPFYRCTEEHEIAEERRLLYVAMTRAQVFLTLTYSQTRMMGGDNSDRDPSEFVALSHRKEPYLFSESAPKIDISVRQQICSMLRRPAPDEEITKDLIMKHVRSAPPLSRWDAPAPGSKARGWMSKMAGKMSRGDAYWASDVDEYALGGQPTPAPAQSGFASASSITRPAPKEVKPPPQRLQSSVRHMPAPLPFSFESTPGPPPEQPTLRSFASTHLSSLNAMKNLGLPPEPAPGASASRPGVSASSSHKASQVTTSMPTKRKSSQVPSSIPSSIPTNGNQAREPPVAGTSAPPVPLARGTKRLGMGRPAPWGSSSANITKRSKS